MYSVFHRPYPRILGLALSALLILPLVATAAFANDGKDSKFQVHGFLTQAWATSDFLEGRFPRPSGAPAGPTSEELQLGIPEDGTFQYRNMAIQFRYDMTDRDVMVVQLSNRALGDSPITEIEDEVELDWAFYERRLADQTSLKIGRVQIPYGIYNEIRDVGTILPFFRPPFVIYQEGAFTSETVDGLSISHLFAPESDWSLRADLYLGEWELVELDIFTQEALLAEVKDSYGSQLWLSTPLSGLRLGLAYQRREVEGGSLRAPGTVGEFDDFLFSVDGNFGRWLLRSEWRHFQNGRGVIPVLLTQDFDLEIDTWYVQFGWYATDSLRFYAQFEQAESFSNASSFTAPQDVVLREDLGVAVNYQFTPSLVLKLEYHEVEGEEGSFRPVFPPPIQLRPIKTDLSDGSYTILSFSAAF